MRGTHTRKRSRTYSSKSRRSSKRTRYSRRGRKSINFSTQGGVAKSFGFRGKKLSRRQWNKKLWDATLMKPHYRCNHAQNNTILTAALPETGTLNLVQAMDNSIAPFWQTAGGAIDPDTGGAVGAIDGDIIIRGGKIGYRITNNDPDLVSRGDPIYYQTFLIKGADNFTPGVLPTSVPLGWDPSLLPEFKNKVGRILFEKSFMLRPGESMAVERRVSIMKVDQIAWTTLGARFYWLVIASNGSDTSVDSSLMTRFVNLSFTGDFTT